MEEQSRLTRTRHTHTTTTGFLSPLNPGGDEAVELFHKAINADRYLKEAWTELGRIFNSASDYSKADKCYREALKVAPNDVHSLNAYAMFLTETNKPKQALQLYDKALSLNSHMERSWLNRGVALEKLGDFDGARQSYKNALGVNPASAEAWTYEGNALFHSSKFSEAIAAYNEALRLDSSVAQTWVNKGICFTEERHFEQALTCFQQASRLGHPGGSDLIAECAGMLSEQ